LVIADQGLNGSLDVCGQLIDTTKLNYVDSVVEATCVNVQGVKQRQLYRQLTATALNCALSGKPDAECDDLVPNFSKCNQLCAGVSGTGVTIDQCNTELDCFNNGGELFNGQCALGTCNASDALCGMDYGNCPCFPNPNTGVCEPQTCVNFPLNCHDQDLCPADTDGDGTPDNDDLFCLPPSAPTSASSSTACNTATKNTCRIDTPQNCTCTVNPNAPGCAP
jgi:hypothetical protein